MPVLQLSSIKQKNKISGKINKIEKEYENFHIPFFCHKDLLATCTRIFYIAK